MGRWCGHKIQLNNEQHLYIISAYRVCKASTTSIMSSTTSSARQQYMIMQENGILLPNPRQQFITDLNLQFKKWEIKPNDHIILMIDANEYTGEEQRGIKKIMFENNMVDVYAENHDTVEFATNINGSKRIDYALATSHTIEYISKIGYTAFYENFETYHRGIICDVDSKLFGTKLAEIASPPVRLIGTNTTEKEAFKYVESLNMQFRQHHIFEKAAELFDISKDNDCDVPMIQEEIDKLDQLITRLMIKCETSTCTKKSPTMWSPAILNSHLMVNYWKMAIKKAKSRIDLSEQLITKKFLLPQDCQIAIDLNTHSLSKALQLEKEKQAILFKHHWDLRREHLQKIENDLIKEKKAAELVQLRALKTRENMKRNYQVLGSVFREEKSKGISYIEIPNAEVPTEYIRITDPETIEYMLLQRNISHFGQAQGTPFTKEAVESAIGYEGTNDTAKEILSGDIPDVLANISPCMTKILKKLGDGDGLNKIDATFSLHEFKRAICKWSEKTSTSPSGRHLGHYKVLANNKPVFTNDNEEEVDISTKILQVYYHITMTCIQAGITLARWCNVTTAMIEKVTGSPKIDKLRVILLYEADYNLLLKILWARKLVWNVHNNKRINDGQSGSRPGRRSIDVVIAKEMKYLYARLTRTSLATMDNDAKSCYDRTQANKLRNMRFKLKTALGESAESYTHTKDSPVYGSGQGSCTSPSLWLIISSLLMDCYSQSAQGMKQSNVQKESVSINHWIEGFVDDTSIFCNNPTHKDNITNLMSSLEKDANLWTNLLAATGGKLELQKCFYYILTWKSIPHSMTEQPPVSFILQVRDDINDEQSNILQKETSTAHKTLGTMKTIVGEENVHYKELAFKSEKFVTKLRHCSINRYQARLAYTTMYIPLMIYSLPATLVDANELKKIQEKSIGEFLSKSGYGCTFPRAATFAPKQFGGLGFGNLHTEANLIKVETIVSHVRANTTLGKSIKNNIEWIQITAGISEPILQSKQTLSYLDNNWLLETQQFLINTNSSVTIAGLWHPKPQRQNDIVLMDAILKLKFSPRKLEIFNYWRLYLRITYLSDLTNAAGDKIQEKFMTANIAHNNNDNDLNWPVQGRPRSALFNVWKTGIKAAFNTDNKGRLSTHKLGDWLLGYYIHPETIDGNISGARMKMYFTPRYPNLSISVIDQNTFQ